MLLALCLLTLSVPAAEAARLDIVFPADQGFVTITEVGGGLCKRTCAWNAPAGTEVTLQALSDTRKRFTFAGWDDQARCAEPPGEFCTVTVPEAGLRISPVFVYQRPGRVTVTLVGPGRIQPQAGWSCKADGRQCRVPRTSGTPVDITVTPAAGRSVAYWSVFECEAPQTTCSTTTDDKDAISVYLTPVTVTLTRSGPGTVVLGSSRCGPGCSRITRDYAWGETVAARITHKGRSFIRWDGVSCRGLRCTFPAREPTAIKLRFTDHDIGQPADPGQLPSVSGKNIKLQIQGPGRVYIVSQKRYCRGGAVCVVPAARYDRVTLRADGPFDSWRSATCPRKQRTCSFTAAYVDSVQAVFRG